MLIAYQAKIIGNQIHWQDTPPDDIDDVEILVLPKTQKIENPPKPKRTPPLELKGKMTFNDDIWDTSDIWEDWEVLK